MAAIVTAPEDGRAKLKATREAASGLWRSEDMTKATVIIPRDAVHHVLQAVGNLGCAQFIDMCAGATAFARPFTGDIRRCEDAERRLRFLHEHMKHAGIVVDAPADDEDAPAAIVEAPALEQLERTLEATESDLRQLSSALESMSDEARRLREEYEVATRNPTAEYLSVEARERTGLMSAPSLIVNGTMPERNVDAFARMVMRITRGNALLRTDVIDVPFVVSLDPTVEPVTKVVFAVFVATERLQQRVQRVAETQGGNIFSSDASALRPPEELKSRLASLGTTIEVTRSQKNALLRTAARDFAEFHRIAATCKAIFGVMNLMRFGGATAEAFVWVPTADIDAFAAAIDRGCERSGETTAPLVEIRPPSEQTEQPTYFRTNAITGTFQGIVDSYGVARYKEVNPGVFTIVTFPYLFGVMYGDMGHGVLLTLFALTLVAFERRLAKQRLNEIFGMIFGGRYLLLGMGIFATYVGILYNDCFGFNVGLFESAYKWPKLPRTTIDSHGRVHHEKGQMGIVHPTFPNAHPSVKPHAPYAFGIDVAWTETDNKLEFYNSVKMKCAVIIGVVQMTAGIFLSLLNHLRRGDWRHVWFGFIPEVVFLSCTFGYMAVLIVIKWVVPWPNTNDAPSLLETMTNFFLAPGVVNAPVFPGQAGLQVFLLLVAVAMVPPMLVAIPYLEYKDHAKPSRDDEETDGAGAASPAGHVEGVELLPVTRTSDAAEPPSGAASELEEEGEKFDFSEVMIHYIIHTIEFVLGCVSNTASYLRLWALSLAHAQLSEVFFNFALVASIGADSGSGFALFIGFAIWLGATIGVLLGMESLSAFLHALRLHWVEFQNKFYAGDGKAFAPLALRDVTAFPYA